jgi:hypothetical protein
VTKIIICFLRLPVRTACFYEQFGIIGQHTNKFHSVWGKRGAPIYGRTPRLLESSFLINTQRNVNRPTAKPIVLSGKRSFGCLVFAAQDQYRITYKICRNDWELPSVGDLLSSIDQFFACFSAGTASGFAVSLNNLSKHLRHSLSSVIALHDFASAETS